MPLYAEVVVPLAISPLTYKVELNVNAGDAVVVGLGRSKIYMGIVWKIHGNDPGFKNIKSVQRIAEPRLTLTREQMMLWEWIADYYMCTLGEVMVAALPSSLKPKGDSDAEYAHDTYRPKQALFVTLHSSISDVETLNAHFESLRRAPKQYEALVELAGKTELEDVLKIVVPRNLLKAASATLNALVAKNIIATHTREAIECCKTGDVAAIQMPQLTATQSKALAEIDLSLKTKDTVLLHGVTGSGKTEIYITLIARELDKGHDVLYLLPEIALTDQLIRRLEYVFGDRVTAYHSRYGNKHRAESYRKVSLGGGHLIVGARSSIFMPFRSLGLIVVDEEHDQSFKQSDPAPRYHARDMAIVLAGFHHAKVILGSATPSIESYSNAKGGKHALVTLTERYGDAVMPKITVSDTLRAVKRGERTSHFNKYLLDKIKEQVEAGNQVILFQNRRGFSPYVECTKCGHVPACPNCNVSLTLHKADGKLRCHYCGYRHSVFPICPACNEGDIDTRGFGTEKVEDELGALIPGIKIARIDADTTRSRHNYRSIIAAFERRSIDVLIGTQMITKGFDFSGVSLVGILNADNLLNYPDFRATERAYQLMTQVSGRAGRHKVAGEVVIQTAQPSNTTIMQVMNGDYEGMVQTQLHERNLFLYPPYCRIIDITLKCRNVGRLDNAARQLGYYLHEIFGTRILGPVPPPVDRIKNEHILCFTIKIEQHRSFARARRLLSESIARLRQIPEYKYVDITCNVDPQ